MCAETVSNGQLLIVEDEAEIRSLLTDFLSNEGYSVVAVPDGKMMNRALLRSSPDLIILDLMLPGEDGLSICQRLRAQHRIPILMLTAKGTEIDRIVGLEMGADDYLPKPFNPRELLARIRAVMRRTSETPGEVWGRRRTKKFCNISIDLDARTVEDSDGLRLNLTTTEFNLLVCFLERPFRVLSRDQLLDLTQGRNSEPFDRAIDVGVSRLRAKLAHVLPPDQQPITTVRNAGYLFSAEVKDL